MSKAIGGEARKRAGSSVHQQKERSCETKLNRARVEIALEQRWACTSGLPGGGASHGGLQMAERTLSGETGSVADVFDAGPRVAAMDREPDCVPEISVAHLPSALADSITFKVTTPVRLPPGRLRLVTRPASTGSAPR